MNSPNQFIPVKDVGNGDGEGSVQVHLDEHIDVAKAKYSSIASDFPMQFLSPTEKPQTFGSFSNCPSFMNRWGMNSEGFGKFFGSRIIATRDPSKIMT